MKYEKSCGAVVYRENNGRLEFLIISHKSDGHWGFPKGHVEQGETEQDTALREVYEETGLNIKLLDGFISREQYSPKKNVIKEVVFFISKANDDIVNIQLCEIKEYKWAAYEEAESLLAYESSIKTLNEACDFLKTKR